MCHTGFVNTFFIPPLADTIAPGSPVALRTAITTTGRHVGAARYCESTTQHNTTNKHMIKRKCAHTCVNVYLDAHPEKQEEKEGQVG